jgi:hypothetical protein
LSQLPEASVLPSGEKATLGTGAVCPVMANVKPLGLLKRKHKRRALVTGLDKCRKSLTCDQWA